MIQEDWILRQIQQMIRFVTGLIFNKYGPKEKEEMIEEYSGDENGKHILDLLNKKDFAQAEKEFQRLFKEDGLDKNKYIYGYILYTRLLENSEEELKAHDFSQERIHQGLEAMIKDLLHQE